MATRYTKNSLIADLNDLNKDLINNGLPEYKFKYQGRNGYHAVDLYKNDKCLRCVDCAEPPKDLYLVALEQFENLTN